MLSIVIDTRTMIQIILIKLLLITSRLVSRVLKNIRNVAENYA